MSHSKNDKASLSVEGPHALETIYTVQRIVELRLNPVRGNFDAAHLKEINRRIFQDLPGLGLDNVTPGQYRPAVALGNDWIKIRRLETVEVPLTVAYAAMDNSALARLDKILKAADPAQLSALKADQFTDAIGKLYSEIDYIHPFPDGNPNLYLLSKTFHVVSVSPGNGADNT